MNHPPDSGAMPDGTTPGDGSPGGDGGVTPHDGGGGDATMPPDAGPPDLGPMDAGDPCAVCDPAAACDTRMGVRCVCPAGYTDVHGDGSLCTPPSACASATCDPHATCTPGGPPPGYTCTCAAGWTGSGTACMDVDECATGAAGCSPYATCANVPGSYACSCLPGFTGDGHTCTDVDECSTGAAGCSPMATCANTPGSFSCTCLPGYTGDGRTCTMMPPPMNVLVFDDTSQTLADDAARALGMTPLVTADGPSFDSAFDSGAYPIVVIDSGYNTMPTDIQSRVGTWASGGNRTLFCYWSLDTAPALASQLGVSLGGSFYTPRPVYAHAGSPAGFFASAPSPLSFMDTLADDGDVVTPLSGFVAADFDFPGGSPAVAVTGSSMRVVVNGFSFYEANSVDGNGNGIMDAQDVWQAELSWVAAH